MNKKLFSRFARMIALNIIIVLIVLTLVVDRNIIVFSKDKEIIFINSSVIRTEEFEKSLPHHSEIVYLAKNRSGIEQITEYLAREKDVDAMRIISHGNAGYFVLNGEQINNQYIAENSKIFSSWEKALSPDADIMLYGCKVAATEEGKKLVKTLAELTGADVAAATEEVGGALFNWDLDYLAGSIETAVLKMKGYEFHLANISVTNNGDSGTGTLRQAIANAAAGDEITFSLSSGNDTITLTTGELTIAKNLTIDGNNESGSGNNITISGNHSSRVFYITGGIVTLNNLIITDGNNYSGGGIYNNSGAILTVDNCEISGNTGSGVGTSGKITINNSSISNNSSAWQGGGIICAGFFTCTISINNSTISGNTATYMGGAISDAMYSYSTITINNSTITGNTANYGGGLFIYYSIRMTINNSTICGNNARNIGGGMYFSSGGNLSIKNTILANNHSNNGTTNDDYYRPPYSRTLTDNGYNIVGYSNVAANATVGFSNATNILYNTQYGNSGTTFTSWSKNATVLDNQNLDIADSLADNGGLTQTLAIGSGSFARSAGVWDASLTTDQRGEPRHQSYPTIGAYEAMYPGYWTGFIGTSWDSAGNWESGSLPIETDDIIIPDVANDPVVSATTTAKCNYLTIAPGGSLTVDSLGSLMVKDNLYLKSDSTGTASLINNGILTVTGTTFAERYMTGNEWHIFSPIASGRSIGTFIQATGNAISTKTVSSVTNYGMMDYSETTNSWNSYYTSSTASAENFLSGEGYCVRRSVDGAVTFTGTLTSGTQTIELSRNGKGWNCIGNPYPSAIGMNSFSGTIENFIGQNSSSLDESYSCVYVLDGASSSYKIINNSPVGFERSLAMNYLQAGQGFLVKAKDNSGLLIQFTSAMQSHQPTTELKSETISWPFFELTVKASEANATTIVAFNNQMTNGLDPTYDAGLLRGSNGFSVYSRLVEDNGVDFAIQCLPEKFDGLIIPLGLDYTKGGEVTFNVNTINLPLDCNLLLEDRETGILTPLGVSGFYTAKVKENGGGTGRFFIHLTNDNAESTSISAVAALKLKTWYSNGSIIINGNLSNRAVAYLSDITGRKLVCYNLRQGNNNVIPAERLTSGVYLLKVIDGEKQCTKKIIVKN